MKPLILDQLRRKWWLWMFFCLIHFALGAATGSVWNSGFIFPTAFLLGPNIWLMDLQRGYSRVALTLPFTARQIGRAWWLISVGFASLALMVFSFLGTTVRFLSEGHGFPFVQWIGYVAANSLLYGSLFWFFSGTLTPPSIDRRKRIQRFVAAGFYLAIVGGCVYLLFDMHNDAVKTTAFFVCTLAMTILGWLRAESMIADYGDYRSASQQPLNSRGQFKTPVGRGGILFMFQTSFVRVWSIGFYMFVVMNIVGIFLQKKPLDWHHLTGNLISNGFFFPFFFGLFFVISTSPIFNLRFLRTMPISTSRLAAVLLGEAILPLLTLCLAFTVLVWHETGSAECVSFFKIEFLIAASISTFVVIPMWNAQKTSVAKSIFLAALILSTFAPALYQLTCMDRRGLPVWFVSLFTTFVVAGSYWTTCRILAKSSSAYRSRQNPLGNQWNWRR